VKDAFGKALGGESLLLECRIQWPDQSIHWVAIRGRVYSNGEARPTRIAGVVTDITQRKQEEELLHQAQHQLQQTAENLDLRVKERTAQLEETVSEMEAFSYSVSHDLRAPLRAMQGYSQVLLEQYSAILDAEGQNYLAKISQASERLDRLTQDLLTYSRVVRAATTMAPVNLDQLIFDVIQQYPDFQAPHADITIEKPLLSVLAHETSLIQCTSNLLGNAIKFVPPGVKPSIRIWTERVDDQIRLNFEDNGIGIAPDQIHRIFKMFERVNKQYEGTGIGLAIVRKAAERMGGSVGVKSVLGKGSTFWLQLPARYL
jgi:signal transduction histidine kinase